MIAPCVEILRELARNFKQILGTDIGTKHHAMDLSVDIPDLMESLDHHEVYVFKKGRQLDPDDPPVKDAVSVGLDDLISGKSNPLNDYNTAFRNLQFRRALKPLVGGDDNDYFNDPRPTVPPPATVPPPETPSISRPKSPLSTEDDCDVEIDVNEEADELEETPPEYMNIFDETLQEPTLGLENPEDVSLDMDAEDLGEVSNTLFDEAGSDEDDEDDESDIFDT